MYNTLMADEQPGEVIIPIERNESTQPPQVVAPSPSFDASSETARVDAPLPSIAPASPEPTPQITEPTEPIVPQPAPQVITPEPLPYTPDHNIAALPPSDAITWQSAEYFAHDKDSSWYGAMVLGSIIISIIVYILNRDSITAVIILFSLIGLTYFSGRKPREQQFSVSAEGVQVGRNFYSFHDFRSFSVVEEPGSVSIILVPLKRFMPAVNIYVSAEHSEQVVNFVASILPFEQLKTDVVIPSCAV